jgi:hypothetical protein
MTKTLRNKSIEKHHTEIKAMIKVTKKGMNIQVWEDQGADPLNYHSQEAREVRVEGIKVV